MSNGAAGKTSGLESVTSPEKGLLSPPFTVLEYNAGTTVPPVMINFNCQCDAKVGSPRKREPQLRIGLANGIVREASSIAN